MPGPPDSQQPPESLRARIARGDRAALSELLAHYLPDLRAFIRLRISPALRELESQSDLVQSTCRELLQRQPDVEYRDEASFRNWLFGAAINKLRDRQKYHFAGKRHPGRVAGGESQLLSQSYSRLLSPSRAAMDGEARQQLEHAFDQLTERHREVLSLRYFVGLSPKEIAAELDANPDSIRRRIARAKLSLARILGHPSEGTP